MCQDTDPNASNSTILYTQNISDNPELIDINMIQSQGGPGGGGGDWRPTTKARAAAHCYPAPRK